MTTHQQQIFTDNQLTDTTTDRQDKSPTKNEKIRRHSPTLNDTEYHKKQLETEHLMMLSFISPHSGNM